MESILISDKDLFNTALSTHYNQELVRGVFSKAIVNFENSLRDFTVLAFNAYLLGATPLPVNNGKDSFDYMVSSLVASNVSYFSTNTFIINEDYPVRVDINNLCGELNNLSPDIGLDPTELFNIMDGYFKAVLRYIWGSNIESLVPGRKLVISAIEGGILASVT